MRSKCNIGSCFSETAWILISYNLCTSIVIGCQFHCLLCHFDAYALCISSITAHKICIYIFIVTIFDLAGAVDVILVSFSFRVL